MFNWLKRRAGSTDEAAASRLVDRFLGPTALVVAARRIVQRYFEDVARGTVTFPAYERKDESVVGIWRDTRLEALRQLWGTEGWRSEPALLAEGPKQSDMIACLLDEQPHLEMPQPRGEPKADTIQALFQVYVYLGEVGSKVGDRETDRLTLKVKRHRNIFDDLADRAARLRDEWMQYREALFADDKGALPEAPKTLFEALYEDVTAKSKSIALTTKWGPDYEANMEAMLGRVREQMAMRGSSEQEIADTIIRSRATFQRVLAAKDPDEFAQG
jgi:hypothetical protein